ncbi:MAG: Fur family transcriptional regulator, peroxide stress response regulator [Patescibacteria group bacterium]|nr:Fur family transcriptional regulator, peroxide stress response regulator [Patescibacteria group bacterium]
MNRTNTTQRRTKCCSEIRQQIELLGHATNYDLLLALRRSFPELSITTIHRATKRLALRGIIAIALPTKDGSMRYDANITPHDHFECSLCGKVYDINIKDKIITTLQSYMNNYDISGRLIINGVCKECIHKNKENT